MVFEFISVSIKKINVINYVLVLSLEYKPNNFWDHSFNFSLVVNLRSYYFEGTKCLSSPTNQWPQRNNAKPIQPWHYQRYTPPNTWGFPPILIVAGGGGVLSQPSTLASPGATRPGMGAHTQPHRGRAKQGPTLKGHNCQSCGNHFLGFVLEWG